MSNLDSYPTQPFIYFLQWRHLDTWYLGYRAQKGFNPKRLETDFKRTMSSDRVKDFYDLHGTPEIRIVHSLPSAERIRELYVDYLRDYNLVECPNYLNGPTSLGIVRGNPRGRPVALTDVGVQQRIAAEPATKTTYEIAKEYGLSNGTVRKWRKGA